MPTSPAYVLVGIDGVDGSGKTTFARELAAGLSASGRPVVVVSADGFLNPSSVRHRRGRHSPLGFWLDSYDLDALERDVLDPFGPRGDGRYRDACLDVSRDVRVTPPLQRAADRSVVLVEGLFMHRDRLAGRWRYSIFLDVPFAVTAARMAERDGTPADPDHPQLRRYVEGQRIYFRSCSPWSRATRVINNADPTAPKFVPAATLDGRGSEC